VASRQYNAVRVGIININVESYIRSLYESPQERGVEPLKVYLLVIYLVTPWGNQEIGVEAMLSRKDCTDLAWRVDTETPNLLSKCTLADSESQIKYLGRES
jgi:hypothetical protein